MNGNSPLRTFSVAAVGPFCRKGPGAANHAYFAEPYRTPSFITQPTAPARQAGPTTIVGPFCRKGPGTANHAYFAVPYRTPNHKCNAQVPPGRRDLLSS
jgi:hypothetical protein